MPQSLIIYLMSTKEKGESKLWNCRRRNGESQLGLRDPSSQKGLPASAAST